ncbi:hypothetical protein [Plantactinospora sp. GCM10030261]|uniref:hypothetical protein n=1 Tax=Plantactinospora sp. GCM10030261 TaxID=3273420 RepID=UPI003607D084
MNDLERRYHRLLRAYPADYRRARGAEIVGTYLDLAAPGRAWPSPAEAADLLRGGLRQRLRAAGAADLVPGVRLAAMLAFGCAVALAALWLAAAEPHYLPVEWRVPTFGPFATLGVIAWAGWLLAALVAAIVPGRATRLAVTTAVALTVALVPLATLTGVPRPPLYVLLPQVALGLLALALPDRPPGPARFGPLLLGALVALVARTMYPVGEPGYYLGYWTNIYFDNWMGAPSLLPAVAVLLLVTATLLATHLMVRRDRRGGWAVLALLTPIGLLAAHPLAAGVGGLRGAPNPDWSALAGTALAVGLLGPALLALAVVVRRRLRPAQPPTVPPADTRCPACGR